MRSITWHRAPLQEQIHPVFMEDTFKQGMYSYVEFYEKDNELHEIYFPV